MICGFVQKQQIRVFLHEYTELEPYFLTSGQISQSFKHIISKKEKSCKSCSSPVFLHGKLSSIGIEHRFLWIFKIHFLLKVADIQPGAQFHFAGIRLYLIPNDLENSCLACAVFSENAYMFLIVHKQIN